MRKSSFSHIRYFFWTENRRGHRRTHSAPPATYPTSPKTQHRHRASGASLRVPLSEVDDVITIEVPADEEANTPPDVGADVTGTQREDSNSHVATGDEQLNANDDVTAPVARSNRLANLKETFKIKKINFRNRLARSRTPNDVSRSKARFDDWSTAPAGGVDLVTPSFRINDDLIEVTLDDSDSGAAGTPRSASPASLKVAGTESDWAALSRDQYTSDEGSDDEVRRQPAIKQVD